MKVHYDSATDTLTVILKDDARVEILDASRRVSEARRVDFQMA